MYFIVIVNIIYYLFIGSWYFLILFKLCISIYHEFGAIKAKQYESFVRALTYQKCTLIANDSERSEECIDFTMICVFFFLSVYTSNFGGGFRCKSEYPWYIIEVKSKQFPTVFKKIEKKNDGKTGIFTQNQLVFDQIEFFLWFVDKKFLDDQKVPYEFISRSVDKFFLALSKYLKI
ncbi:Uncharacterized protein FWK35_00017106 [Aphis craccivora]|uniref:Uncharacterized protein n=1 Tax=Aphis craccivora TaxID=307492 RepID=A0A6G0ZFV3_APHCR|nr:Uncharacterized protein FWK35_00017106 [Aphis craccivora]